MRRGRVRGLIIPSVIPLVRYFIDPSSIWYLDVYWEVRGSLKYEDVKIGSFSPLYADGFRGYNVVFLHPCEVLDLINGKIVSVPYSIEDDVKVIDFSFLIKKFYDSKEVMKVIAELWKDNWSFFIISPYVAEAVLHNLTEVCKGEIERKCYCYGRVERVLRKLYPEDLINMSELVGDFRDGGLDPEIMVEGIRDTLFYCHSRWPWMTYGLVIDRSRRGVTVLNPEVMDYILVEDIEELRIVNYCPDGCGGNYIPILVVKKLSIEKPLRVTPDLFKPYSKPPRKLTLGEELVRSIQRMEKRIMFGSELVSDVQEGLPPREVEKAVSAITDRIFSLLTAASSRKERKDGVDEESPI